MKDKPEIPGKQAKDERKAKLAAELRANLMKRKAQSRQRQKAMPEGNASK